MQHRYMSIAAILAVAATVGVVRAAPPEVVTVIAKRGFDETVTGVEQAIEAHSLVRIATASASRAATSRGIKIPGNAVVLAFNNSYAVRLLSASVPAGIEAPMRFYVTENRDGLATISYRKPSAVLMPYSAEGLGELGRELDDLFAAIAADAATR
jgi:uncharacterized protein (DUF302 family)